MPQSVIELLYLKALCYIQRQALPPEFSILLAPLQYNAISGLEYCHINFECKSFIRNSLNVL
jgi:hypothetical protein